MADYILFDFDGTVFDTVEGITKSVRYALNRQGIDAELKALRCYAGPPLVEMFMEQARLTREQAEQALLDFRARYVAVGLYESRVFPGVKELLKDLRAAGKKIGIATSKPQPHAEKLLARGDMLKLFDAICGSDSRGNNSSKAQVLAAAMKMLGARPEVSVLVGDTKWDVAGARACGIKCIGVGYGYAAPGELEAAGADVIAPDLEALREILLGKN